MEFVREALIAHHVWRDSLHITPVRARSEGLAPGEALDLLNFAYGRSSAPDAAVANVNATTSDRNTREAYRATSRCIRYCGTQERAAVRSFRSDRWLQPGFSRSARPSGGISAGTTTETTSVAASGKLARSGTLPEVPPRSDAPAAGDSASAPVGREALPRPRERVSGG